MQMPSDREIQERFDDLPQEVQMAIQSADITAVLTQVGQTHGLHIDQLGALEDETLLVMLGFANPAQFGVQVQSAIGVDAGVAQAIAEEISAQLFVPIRSAMRAYMEERLHRASNNTEPSADLQPPATASSFTAPPPSSPQPGSFAPSTSFSPLAARNSQLANTTAPAIPIRPPASLTNSLPVSSNQPPVTSPAPGGGKIIMPAGLVPTIHPADQMLSQPTMATPAIANFGAPGALQTPATPAAQQYATDPYREPVE